MRRDLDELKARFDAIDRAKRGIWRWLSDTQGPWPEEHYDAAHRAAQKAQEELQAVYADLHGWAGEHDYVMKEKGG